MNKENRETYCPFTYGHTPWNAGTLVECRGTKCAWWSRRAGKCVIHDIADAVAELEGAE